MRAVAVLLISLNTLFSYWINSDYGTAREVCENESVVEIAKCYGDEI